MRSAPSIRELEHALHEGGSLCRSQSLAKNAFSQRSIIIRLLRVRGEGNALSQCQASCTKPLQPPQRGQTGRRVTAKRPFFGASSCEVSVGCSFGPTEEIGVTKPQHPREGPNEHPPECPSDTAASRGDGASGDRRTSLPCRCSAGLWRIGKNCGALGQALQGGRPSGNGLTPSPIRRYGIQQQSCHDGCTATTGTDHMAVSAQSHQSVAPPNPRQPVEAARGHRVAPRVFGPLSRINRFDHLATT